MERGVKKSDVTCEIAFRPIVSPYVPLMTREKKKEGKKKKMIKSDRTGGQRK